MKNPSLPIFLLVTALGMGACNRHQPVSDPRESANAFFLKVGESRFKQAYESASFAFRAKTNFKNFEATARELGLSGGGISCNWQNEEATERDFVLRGEVTSSGTAVPLIVTLVKEGREWRVFSLLTPGRGGERDKDQFSMVGKGDSFNSLANKELPLPKQLDKLTMDGLLLFNDALKRRDFTEFYSKVSQAWQNQLTIGQLQRAFQPFIDAGVDIHEIEHLSPIYDKTPEINTDGFLIIQGHYDTKPYSTAFRLRFVYEFPAWKLIGVEIQIRD